jgi:hypothetical protein
VVIHCKPSSVFAQPPLPTVGKSMVRDYALYARVHLAVSPKITKKGWSRQTCELLRITENTLEKRDQYPRNASLGLLRTSEKKTMENVMNWGRNKE